MEQSYHLAFMSLMHMDEKQSPLHFIKKDVILLSSLFCGITPLIWLVIAFLRARTPQKSQPSPS